VRLILACIAVSFMLHEISRAQVENVPVDHPVYSFLKRMELKGIISRYFDVILPLSRGEVAKFLVQSKQHDDELTQVERETLADFFLEFQFDISKTTDGSQEFFKFPEQSLPEAVGGFFNNSQKYLTTYADSTVSVFVDGLIDIDARRSTGDALGNEHAEYIQFGGRIQGDVGDHIGYYVQGTNAELYGSRAVLDRDPHLSQSLTLNDLTAQNFDFTDGYARYQSGILSVEIGQERITWGTGYGDKLVLSENPADFPFVRMDAQYKSFKYTIINGWLLGAHTSVVYTLPPDTTRQYNETLMDDKFFAAHRLGFSLSGLDLGFEEMLIYSGRSYDLAYGNPVTLFESAERDRGQLDKNFWVFDAQVHYWKNVELQGSIMFGDINFARWFTNDIDNQDAWQVGAMFIDPLGVSNQTFFLEYTHIEPYMFSFNRSPDNYYGSGGRILGDTIGPNAESYLASLTTTWTHKITSLISYEFVRKGSNVYKGDSLVDNVGGDYLLPWLPPDSRQKQWLGGHLVLEYRLTLGVTYELFKKMLINVHYIWTAVDNNDLQQFNRNKDYGMNVSFDY
jgi:hypothetical protein